MVLLHTIIDNNYKFFNDSQLQFIYEKKSVNFNTTNKNKKHVIWIGNLYKNLNQSSTKILNEYVDYKFISRNFWNKFFNQYFQETIFISIANPLSENYISKLKNNGLSVYKGNDYKNFLIDFSKDLINGKIPVLLKSSDYNYQKIDKFLIVKNNHTYIKYIWRKGLNWHIYYLYSKYLSIQHNILNKNSWINIKNLELNSLPIFAVTNRHNKLIMAESPDRLLLKKNFFQILDLQFLNNIFLSNNNLSKKIYTGLLFINPEDALEYKQYITYKYKQAQNNIDFKFFIGKLNLYSRLLSAPISLKEFRLIPDLQEIGDLIYKYQYNNNISFDKNQKYGKHIFQGQPIYRIKSILAKNINTNKKENLDYYYNVYKNNKTIKYQAVFLNYKTALIAWNRFKEEHPYYKLPKKPLLYVSNLENFLAIYKNDHINSSFIFVPSPKTYNFIKEYKENVQIKNFHYFINNRTLYLQSFIKRLIWSLTSRQPLDW
uniref:Ycf80 n=1 Tax=Dipterocladia arabiensis TaxID=2007176 RepID=A0A1Z1M0G3_9FLOR|nr:hypothetical protein [Dipterocladia arabiensis]ARW59351.1 hypothetical protein [Dipterocladia arabiensis]